MKARDFGKALHRALTGQLGLRYRGATPEHDRCNEAHRGHGRPNRVIGALTLRLLRSPDGWIHRRVESVTVSDPVVSERRVSLDFTLSPGAPVLINGKGEEVHFLPLAFMAKRPMTKFSVRDEHGTALPVLTSRRNGALSLSILVVLAEALAGEEESPIRPEDFPLPDDLEDDLWSIVFGDPLGNAALRARILNEPCQPHLDARSLAWRRFLADDGEFMEAAEIFSSGFLLTVALTGKRGVRRIVKYSFEEHGKQPKLRLPIPLSWMLQAWARFISGRGRPSDLDYRPWWLWLQRAVGWKPMATLIALPSMPLGGGYHFEVAAPEGLQITLAQLCTDDHKVIDQCMTSQQRVHLYSRGSGPGYAVVATRPRPFTIVRSSFMVSLFALASVAVALALASPFNEDLGPAVSILLLVPAGLAAYTAKPVTQPSTNEAVFGLRLMTTLAGVWPLLAAFVLIAGTQCHTVAAKPGAAVSTVCQSWSTQEPLLILLLIAAGFNSVLMFVYLTLVNRPREQAFHPVGRRWWRLRVRT